MRKGDLANGENLQIFADVSGLLRNPVETWK